MRPQRSNSQENANAGWLYGLEGCEIVVCMLLARSGNALNTLHKCTEKSKKDITLHSKVKAFAFGFQSANHSARINPTWFQKEVPWAQTNNTNLIRVSDFAGYKC